MWFGTVTWKLQASISLKNMGIRDTLPHRITTFKVSVCEVDCKNTKFSVLPSINISYHQELKVSHWTLASPVTFWPIKCGRSAMMLILRRWIFSHLPSKSPVPCEHNGTGLLVSVTILSSVTQLLYIWVTFSEASQPHSPNRWPHMDESAMPSSTMLSLLTQILLGNGRFLA